MNEGAAEVFKDEDEDSLRARRASASAVINGALAKSSISSENRLPRTKTVFEVVNGLGETKLVVSGRQAPVRQVDALAAQPTAAGAGWMDALRGEQQLGGQWLVGFTTHIASYLALTAKLASHMAGFGALEWRRKRHVLVICMLLGVLGYEPHAAQSVVIPFAAQLD